MEKKNRAKELAEMILSGELRGDVIAAGTAQVLVSAPSTAHQKAIITTAIRIMALNMPIKAYMYFLRKVEADLQELIWTLEDRLIEKHRAIKDYDENDSFTPIEMQVREIEDRPARRPVQSIENIFSDTPLGLEEGEDQS